MLVIVFILQRSLAMSGPGDDDKEREEAESEAWEMENDPYSDDEKDNIGDNGEGNESKD